MKGKVKVKAKVLAIDDDADFLELCRIYLSRHFEVHLAFNGEEGIRKLHELKPSAVLLDLRMPRVSGFQVLQYMQFWTAMRKIPVIVVTAGHLDRRVKRFLRSGANVYRSFEKTVSLGRLFSETRRAVLMGRLYRSTPQMMAKMGGAELVVGEDVVR